jgi:hypothetical protein
VAPVTFNTVEAAFQNVVIVEKIFAKNVLLN